MKEKQASDQATNIQATSIQATKTEVPIKSPCVSVCALNEEDVCTGCFRTGAEIRDWGIYNNNERKQVLILAREREKQVNPFL